MRGALSRTLGVLLVLAVTVAGLIALADATKYRGQRGIDGETRIEFSVHTKGFSHGDADAAAALWYACVGNVSWAEASPPQPTTDGTFVAAVRPSLGEDARRRFRGCLEDATVDKISGEVIAIHTSISGQPDPARSRDEHGGSGDAISGEVSERGVSR